MKLQSYAIREALVEGRHMDAARLLARLYGVDISDQQESLKITRQHHTDYAIRVWLGRYAFEWEAGNFYSATHDRYAALSGEIVIWSPHENL